MCASEGTHGAECAATIYIMVDEGLPCSSAGTRADVDVGIALDLPGERVVDTPLACAIDITHVR